MRGGVLHDSVSLGHTAAEFLMPIRQRYWTEITESSRISPIPTHVQSPQYQHPPLTHYHKIVFKGYSYKCSLLVFYILWISKKTCKVFLLVTLHLNKIDLENDGLHFLWNVEYLICVVLFQKYYADLQFLVQHVRSLKVHHYSFTQNRSTALKFLCALPVHSSFSQPLVTADLSNVSIAFPFPECHIFGVA